MNCNRLSVLLTSCSLLAPAFAQEFLDGTPTNAPQGLEARRMPPPLVPIHTAADDQGLPYGVWAAGAEYKASFHDGATFVPYLGAAYPANQSLRWRTVSARIGENELIDGSPRLSHAGYHAEYDLGGIVEAYDVRANGLEQTFVIGRRPAAAGDLVIRGAITTALQTTPRAGVHGKLVFRDAAGTPILEYGAATAIDGSGRTQPVTTTVNGDTITLRLDGSWLANADFPLVVDPLIGVVYSVGGAEIVQMDLARDTILQTGNIWRSASRYASATDADVWLRRVDDDGNGDATVYTDITASWSSFDTSIGIHQAAQCGLLAFTRHFASSDLRQLRCHKHHRGDMTLQTSYFAIGVGSNQAWRPDVASDLSPFGAPNLLVVFQREDASPFAETPTSGVYGVAIDMTGIGSAGASFAIADGAFEDNERPQVGKVQSGAAQVWTVAYQIIGNGAMVSPHVDWDVEMRRVDSNGTVSSPKVIGQANGVHDFAPRVAGYNDVQLLAWVESDPPVVGGRPTGDNGMRLVTRVYEWNGAIFLQPNVGWTHSVNPDARVVLTGVDVDRNTMSHYAMTLRSTVTGNAYVRILGYRSHYLNGATLYNAGAGETTISGGVAFDDDAELFLLGYGVNDGVANSSHVDRYAYPYQQAPAHAGLGCSPAQLSWVGTQLIGDEGSEIRLANFAPGALATVLVGTTPFSALLTGLPPVHPGCWLLVPNTGAGSLATMPIGFGPSVSYQIDLPEWLPAMTLYFQGVHFNAANTEVFTTDRLEVSFVK